jgi:FkbM family methyltransferase
MRIFVDVGAHYGETLEVALDPRWQFDRVYSLEPARACVDILSRYRDPRVVVVPFGLSNRTTTAILYDPGSLGASVYADKHGLRGESIESIQLVRASTWLSEHTTADDDIFLKLNCEGSECDVIEDLLAAGLLVRVRSIYVDFDVRKVPSQSHRQHAIQAELVRTGIDFATSATWSVAGKVAVSRWLHTSCPAIPGRAPGVVATVRYRARLHRPAYMWIRTAAQRFLPLAGFRLLARHFGRYSRRNPRSSRASIGVATRPSGRE